MDCLRDTKSIWTIIFVGIPLPIISTTVQDRDTKQGIYWAQRVFRCTRLSCDRELVQGWLSINKDIETRCKYVPNCKPHYYSRGIVRVHPSTPCHSPSHFYKRTQSKCWCTYLYLSLASNCGSLLSKLFEMKLITLFVFRVRFREQSVSSIANVNRPQPPPIPSSADAASPMPICVLM